MHNKLTDIGPIASLIDYLTKDPWITGQIIFCKSTCGRDPVLSNL